MISIPFFNSSINLSFTFYLVGIALLVLLAKWHNSNDPHFDFRQALIDPKTNRISFSRLGHFVALVISTVIICYEAVNGRLSGELYLSYLATWAGTYTLAKHIDSKKNISSDQENSN